MRFFHVTIVAAFVIGTASLSACRSSGINSLSTGIGAMQQNPVYVLKLTADENPIFPVPAVIFSGVGSFPRVQSVSLTMPELIGDNVLVSAIWLEIMTGRAYEAEAMIDTSDLAVSAGGADLAVLLLPGGWLVVGSDPVPRSKEIITRDIAKVCGERRPDLDRNIRSEVNAIAALKEALAFAADPIDAPPCSEGE